MSEFIRICLNSEYIWNINFFSENNYIIFCTYYFNKSPYFWFYKKEDNVSFTSKVLIDDLFTQFTFDNSTEPYSLRPLGISENGYYFSIEPYIIIEKAKKMKELLKPDEWILYLEMNPIIAELISKLTYDSNPIIVLYKNVQD